MQHNGYANTTMKALIHKPFLFGLLLSLPLWIILHNFIVALSLGLLLSFLIAMLVSLHRLKSTQDAAQHHQPPRSPD